MCFSMSSFLLSLPLFLSYTHWWIEADLTKFPVYQSMACQAQWTHSSLFPCSVCTHQPPVLHFKLVMMTLWASCHATLLLWPTEHNTTLLWVSTCSYSLHSNQSSQSISQPDSHAQPTSLRGEMAVTAAKETGWFTNPAVSMIYIKVCDPPSWLNVMEGAGWRLQMHLTCHMAQFFYFEWWGYRFLVDKIGHIGLLHLW